MRVLSALCNILSNGTDFVLQIFVCREYTWNIY